MDWPSLATIAQSQSTHLTRRTRRRLNRIKTATPGVYVYVNAEQKIVIPIQDEQICVNIIATAHQGKHGHCKCKQTMKLINEVFIWHGMKEQVKEWVER